MANPTTSYDHDSDDDDSSTGREVVREWDRAVGVCFKDGVVLAAHRLDEFGRGENTVVSAVTGEPVPAEKARQALIRQSWEIVEEGGSRLSGVKKAAKFLPNFYEQTKHKDFIELLVVGCDQDKDGFSLVPCLSFANASGSFNPDAYAIGSGSMYSQSVLDMLWESDMALKEAEDVALRAIYFAAFCHEVEGQAVEAVDVCVMTSLSIIRKHHDVKDLHAKFAPLLKEREEELLRNPVPSCWYTVSEDEDDDMVYK